MEPKALIHGFVERLRCPTCDSPEASELYSCDYSSEPIKSYLESFYGSQGGVEFEILDGARFVVDRCCSCGLVYQRHVPNDAVAHRLYEHWIDPTRALANRPSRTDLRYFMDLSRQVVAIIRHFDRHPSQLDLLDFGMGWADWCHMAQSFGCRVAGMELSETRLAHARSRGVPVVAWHELDSRRFDFINTEQVFEHVTDPFEVLRHLVSALKPGGLVRISVPDGWNVEQRLAKANWTVGADHPDSLMAIAPLEHVNCFSYDSLVRFASRVGLVERPLRRMPRSRDDILRLSVRDFARPLGRAATRLRSGERVGSTSLTFAHRNA